MIVYHGTPIGGDGQGATRFLAGRHALIPYPAKQDCAIAFDVCQTVVFDNGAFSAWKKGTPVSDWSKYYEWCLEYHRHPAFNWAIIPDVIDGTEADNDALLFEWPTCVQGVPVWHMHESMERLDMLASSYRLICIGSSGLYKTTGTKQWWVRMIQAMDLICDEKGRPKCKLHGLRMAAREYTSRFPFASVDSTNAAQNSMRTERFGTYVPPSRGRRAEAIAWRMEAFETASHWRREMWECKEGVQYQLEE